LAHQPKKFITPCTLALTPPLSPSFRFLAPPMFSSNTSVVVAVVVVVTVVFLIVVVAIVVVVVAQISMNVERTARSVCTDAASIVPAHISASAQSATKRLRMAPSVSVCVRLSAPLFDISERSKLLLFMGRTVQFFLKSNHRNLRAAAGNVHE